MIQCKKIRVIPISEVIPNPKNRNKHTPEQIERLKKIIEYQGFRVPIIISNRSGKMVAGHGRLLAAKEMGLEEVPAIFQDFESEEQEFAAGVSDNSIASWAELDLSGINADLADMGPFDIDLLGIKDFVVDMSEKDAEGEDDVPEVPKVAKSKLGELYILGNHRLLCGDSTDSSQVSHLMNGEKADMVFTDPPYNVGFKYNAHDDTKIEYEDWKVRCESWLKQWQTMSDRIVITPGCYNLELWCRISKPSHIAPWIKTNAQVTGRVTHFWHWEPIFFIGEFKRKRPDDIFEHHVTSGFLREQSDSPVHKGDHPCPKPLPLWKDIVENFSEPNEILFEPFCGSGTTLIACEKTKRRCFGIEIDPVYVDVILDRFQKYSGIEPKREDGTPWSYVKDEGD